MSVLAKRKHLDQSKTAFASTRAIKTSVQKLNLVAKLVTGMKVEEALLQLQFSRKKVAHNIREVLSAAVANAENNNGLDIDKLIVSEVLVGKSFVMKRFRARARGRAGKIMKPYSNLTVFVSERD